MCVNLHESAVTCTDADPGACDADWAPSDSNDWLSTVAHPDKPFRSVRQARRRPFHPVLQNLRIFKCFCLCPTFFLNVI